MNDIVLLAVVDDHPLMRAGMISLISEFEGMQIIFEAANGLEMQSQLQKGQLPDIILMDIRMKCMDGFEATAWLREHYPSIKVLALSMVEDGDAVVEMIRNGACGFILKESRPAEIVHAIKTVAERGYFLNELVSGKLIHSLQHPNSCGNGFHISEKELTFIRLCCTELTYKEIAGEMGLSPHTIENYREAMFRKLDVKSRSGIIMYAVRNKVIKLG
jgi:DNA-binding NarL/FixJ family response regulator